MQGPQSAVPWLDSIEGSGSPHRPHGELLAGSDAVQAGHSPEAEVVVRQPIHGLLTWRKLLTNLLAKVDRWVRQFIMRSINEQK